MKKLLVVSSAILMAASLWAASKPVKLEVKDASLYRVESNDSSLLASYSLDPSSLNIPSNSEVLLRPVVRFNNNDSILLQPVIIAGRNAYLSYKRNHDLPAGVELLRADKTTIFRQDEVIAKPSGATTGQLLFETETRGCRCKEEGRKTLDPNVAVDLTPKPFQMVVPEKQLASMEQPIEQVVKSRAISRSAYVNYPVGKTQLLPDFRNNPIELAAILATIDSVRNDRDLTVKGVNIHGFASPEGSLALNTRLAQGRTESLRQWVDARYGFGELLTTAYTPEDWAGLRKWVAASSLPNRQPILKIIDSRMADDEKDARIKAEYPADYAQLLSQVYPTLRRADYRIDYVVRNFTDAETISREYTANPTKLSLEELMLLARTYDEGSDTRTKLLLEGGDLFPDDPRANLHAAFAAMSRGDLVSAKRFLDRSGDSDVATYARGVYYLYKGDQETAKTLLRKAADAGVDGAEQALRSIMN